MFNFIGNFQTGPQSGCTFFTSSIPARIPVALYSHGLLVLRALNFNSSNGCTFLILKDILKNFQACPPLPAQTLKKSYGRESQVLHFYRQEIVLIILSLKQHLSSLEGCLWVASGQSQSQSPRGPRLGRRKSQARESEWKGAGLLIRELRITLTASLRANCAAHIQ